eukprot:TRINITY_DN29088_c0_g1_i1.p1 TRINITY_DN29088_c0_g1~~TRINITY_DN29088_c0_g1_i1.p1  ORF type:complete len:128 (-),score=30.45 TRINITY_DN29088_c0_g1_i1:35-418(-)
MFNCIICRNEIASLVLFIIIRRPTRSTQSRSSAASDVYKRQLYASEHPEAVSGVINRGTWLLRSQDVDWCYRGGMGHFYPEEFHEFASHVNCLDTVSYTHLRAHETVLDLVCRLLLEKKNCNIVHLL